MACSKMSTTTNPQSPLQSRVHLKMSTRKGMLMSIFTCVEIPAIFDTRVPRYRSLARNNADEEQFSAIIQHPSFALQLPTLHPPPLESGINHDDDKFLQGQAGSAGNAG